MPAIDRPPETARRLLTAFGPRPVTTADAYSLGLTRAELRAAERRGLVVIPRRGLVLVTSTDTDRAAGASTSHEQRRHEHITAVRAALESVGDGAVVTHDSAALVHGLARPSVRPPGAVTLARPGVQNYSGPGLVVRGSAIPAGQVTIVGGIPVTGLPRTAVDLARGRSLEDSLIPLDHAARLLASTLSGARARSLRDVLQNEALREHVRHEFEAALESCRGWWGVVAARHGVAHLDPRSESPLESRSRGWFVSGNVHSLDIGVRVEANGSTYWADFCSRRHRLIGEADGWSKYGDRYDRVRSALKAERRRQQDLEGDGWRVIRWTSDDTGVTVTQRMRDALGPG